MILKTNTIKAETIAVKKAALNALPNEYGVKFAFVFLAGLLSFLSPCVLPIVPGYLCFLAGTSLDKIIKAKARICQAETVISVDGIVKQTIEMTLVKVA